MTVGYNVGDNFEATYTNPPVSSELQYKIGEIIPIRLGTIEVAKFEVVASTEEKIFGKIVETIEVGTTVRDNKNGVKKFV